MTNGKRRRDQDAGVVPKYTEPFSGETMIGFRLPESMTATLKVMGGPVRSCTVSGSYSSGNHQLTLEAGSFAGYEGCSLYQLETKSGVINKRMVAFVSRDADIAKAIVSRCVVLPTGNNIRSDQ
ncbi:MAG: hypothetical protein R2806_08320 [Saprospiraceae bacterium]